MQKDLLPDWRVQDEVDKVVAPYSSACAVIALVQYDADQAVRDEQCPSVGRVSWRPNIFVAPGDPSEPELRRILNAKIADLQKRYDLGVTREC